MPQIKLYHPNHGYVKEYNGDRYDCEVELKKWRYFYGKKFDECTIERINYTKQRIIKQVVYRPTGTIYRNATEAAKYTPHSFDTIRKHLKNNFDTPPPKGRLFHYLEE